MQGKSSFESQELRTNDEYIHAVASNDVNADANAHTVGAEHIRLIVEGVPQQLDRQYGAGQGEVPLRTGLEVGRESTGIGNTVYEVSADTQFWHNLKALDFSQVAPDPAAFQTRLDLTPADHGGNEVAVLFSDRIAQVRSRFDREALRLIVDLDAA